MELTALVCGERTALLHHVGPVHIFGYSFCMGQETGMYDRVEAAWTAPRFISGGKSKYVEKVP